MMKVVSKKSRKRLTNKQRRHQKQKVAKEEEIQRAKVCPND